MKSFALGLKLRIKKSGGSSLDAGSNLILFDESGYRILLKCSLFLNGTPCDRNTYFGLYSTIKSLLEMSKKGLKTIGWNMYYEDTSTKTYGTYTPAFFQNQTSDEIEFQTECKNVLHMTIHLKMDMSSAGIFY